MMSVGSSRTGVKHDLLKNSFLTLFPLLNTSADRIQWKNSQGIFDATNHCAVKRSMCFSSRAVSLESSSLPRSFINRYPRSSSVWGLCGFDSTRANKATDGTFILCKKTDQHFVAEALVFFSEDSGSETGFRLDTLDDNQTAVERVLLDMKKETEAYSKRKRTRSTGDSSQEPRQKKTRAGGCQSIVDVPPAKPVAQPVEAEPARPVELPTSLPVELKPEGSPFTVFSDDSSSVASDSDNTCLLSLLGTDDLPPVDSVVFSDVGTSDPSLNQNSEIQGEPTEECSGEISQIKPQTSQIGFWPFESEPFWLWDEGGH